MKHDSSPAQSIDEYIARCPSAVRETLQQMRTTIAQAAPGTREAIKYGLPTFVAHGSLVHFGAFQKHIGFYAMPTGHAKFERELSAYKSGKGSVQFPLDQPMPLSLIRKMVKFRVEEDATTARGRKRSGR